MTFDNLGLIAPISKALLEKGYISPTPIQAEAIPAILKGSDLLGCAQTGTGKTAAFSIPIIQRLSEANSLGGKSGIKALVLTPTRELAIQIADSFKEYGCHTKLKHSVVFGGVGQKPQTDALRRGVDVLIATPGRLLDLINQGFVKFSSLEYFVLDEADRMLDMGFIHDIKRIIPMLPKKRQTLFFSATMPPAIEKLANTILSKPQKVEVTPTSSTVDKIEQHLYFADKKEKLELLINLLKDETMQSILVFTRTKHRADNVARSLCKANIITEAIHGNKSQNARQRALNNFKDGTTRVLIATDIAARGIDIDHLSHVINFEMPDVPETYVHRIGRTGRAGRMGVSISFCDADEVPMLKDIEKLIDKKIPVAGGVKSFSEDTVRKAVTKKNDKKRENTRQRTESRSRAKDNRPSARDNRPSARGNRSSSGEGRSERSEGGSSAAPRSRKPSDSRGAGNRRTFR